LSADAAPFTIMLPAEMPAGGAKGYTAGMDRPTSPKIAIPAALAAALLLSACGNKGPLVLPPPPSAEDAELMEAAAVDDAGALADPTPADTDPPILPPDRPPVEADPEAPPVPDDGAGNG
jgi:predicted small lipoprotein YifL